MATPLTTQPRRRVPSAAVTSSAEARAGKRGQLLIELDILPVTRKDRLQVKLLLQTSDQMRPAFKRIQLVRMGGGGVNQNPLF